MTYDAKTLEREFKGAASLRIARKNRGNRDYSRDADYWTGGKCDWGGGHNLSKDCQEISKGFGKLDDLKKVEQELQRCTSEREFNSTKSRLIRQAEELENGLQAKTSATSSMFWICIIWSYYESFLESKLRPLRSEVSRLKENINNQQYKHYEEIKLLKLEQKQIENRMRENKRKAENEKDPDKKALLLIAIEEDSKLLKKNLEKQKAIPTSNLRFEPDKYVSDLINSMKEAIKNSGGGGPGDGSGSGRNKNKNDNDDSDDDINCPGSNTGGGSNPTSNEPKGKESNQPTQQQLIIFGSIACLVIFYLYSQKSKPEPNYYDF